MTDPESGIDEQRRIEVALRQVTGECKCRNRRPVDWNLIAFFVTIVIVCLITMIFLNL